MRDPPVIHNPDEHVGRNQMMSAHPLATQHDAGFSEQSGDRVAMFDVEPRVVPKDRLPACQHLRAPDHNIGAGVNHAHRIFIGPVRGLANKIMVNILPGRVRDEELAFVVPEINIKS